MTEITLEKRFEDYEALIHDTVRKVWRRCGGDLEDMVSVAHEAFVKAHSGHDSTRSKFTTYLVRCIRNGLINSARKAKNQVETKPLLSQVEDPRNQSPLIDLLDEFSDDAKHIAKLVITSPPELACVARFLGRSEKQTRAAIVEHLQNAGWCIKRISRSFKEIRTVLNG